MNDLEKSQEIETVKNTLIAEAQKNLTENPQNFAHDLEHARRVAKLAQEIGEHVEEEFDPNVVEIIAWWHDVALPGMANDDESRIATKIGKYLSEKFENKSTQQIVLDSLMNHEWGSTPSFVEGKILFDADKLELLSEERIQPAFELAQQGNLDEGMLKALEDVQKNWLPILEDRLHFGYSKQLYRERVGEAMKRFQELSESGKAN